MAKLNTYAIDSYVGEQIARLSAQTCVNVLHYGAVADGTTNNATAIAAAIAAAQSTGARGVYFPAGASSYYVSNSAGSQSGIDPGSGIVFLGDGIGRTIIQYDEGTSGSPSRLFYRSAANPGYDAATLRDPILFQDLEFRGTFSTSDASDRGGTCIHLDAYREVRFHRCKFKDISTFATDLHFNNTVIWDHCEWEDVARDGARARDCFSVQVRGCRFQRLGDDAVAWHTADYISTDSYNPDNGDPRRVGLHVSDCFFLDTMVCISALGARVCNIHHNTFLRGRETPIYIVNSTSTEGVQPIFSISVKDNIILDRADASTVAAIQVSGQTPVGAVATSSVIPGRPASGTGAFVKPWDWTNADAGDAADAFPPIADVDISGNIIGRTLPTVANYSDWGFGYVGNTTKEYDPAITNAGLRWSTGINVSIGFRVKVCGNVISHVTDGILLSIPSINPNSFATLCSDNIVFDATSRCVVQTGASSRRSDTLITNNHLNGDYYREASNSNADGTYDSGSAAPTGIDIGGNGGCVISGNMIQNVARVYAVSALADCQWFDNTVICDPVALGDNASNKGVRNVPNPADGFKFIIADCDPTSATFGQLKNNCVESASAQPSTGTYLRGMVVRNNAPSLAGGKVTYGWVRLTTGTGHVDGTDWTPLVIPNS